MKTNTKPSPLVRREFLQIYGGALVAAVLSGCGGGSAIVQSPGGSPSPFPTPTPTPTPTLPPGGGDNSIVVRPGVALLPADGTVQVADLGGGTFGIRGAAAALAVGSVLVSAAGNGLLRKVTGVRPAEADGTVIVETVQGTLEDVFVKAQFRQRLALNADDVARIETVPGVDYTGPAVGGASLRRSLTRGRDYTTLTNFEFALKSTAIMDTTEAEVNGKVKLRIELELDGSIENGTVESFTCIFHITPAAEVEFAAKKKFQKSLFKVHYAAIYMNPIVFAIGVVPVVVVPQIDLFAEMNGSVEGGVSFTCGFSVPSRIGATYTAAGGWDGIAEATPTGNLLPKENAFASIKLEFNPIRVDGKTLLYGIAGPQVSVSAPSFEVKLQAKAGSETSVKFTGAVGAKAGATIKVEVVGKDLAPYDDKTALEFKNIVYEKTFLPGSAEVEVN